MMRLKTVHEGPWRIVAPMDADGSCALWDELEALAADAQTEATAAKFVSIWERIPPQGPHELPDGMYHRIDAKHEIYEFRARQHRILCFRADGRIVICSHLFLKQSNRVPAKERDKAAALRKRYLDTQRKGQVSIED